MDDVQRSVVNLQEKARKKKARSKMDTKQRQIVRSDDRERKAVQWCVMDKSERDNMRIQKRYSHKKARSGINDIDKHQQRIKDSNRKKQERFAASNTEQAAVQTFRHLIKCEPVYVCTCCYRLLYGDCVLLHNHSSYSNCGESLLKHAIIGYLSIDINEYTCKTCNWSLKRTHLPAQAVANNIQLDEMPAVLRDLSTLETSPISKRIPFMKVLALPRGKQRAIHGCIINVPVNPEETCSILPRLPSSSQS